MFFRKSKVFSKSFPIRANCGIPKGWDTKFHIFPQGLGPSNFCCYTRRREFPSAYSRRGRSMASDAENNLLIKSNCKGSSRLRELKVPCVLGSLAPIY